MKKHHQESIHQLQQLNQHSSEDNIDEIQEDNNVDIILSDRLKQQLQSKQVNNSPFIDTQSDIAQSNSNNNSQKKNHRKKKIFTDESTIFKKYMVEQPQNTQSDDNDMDTIERQVSKEFKIKINSLKQNQNNSNNQQAKRNSLSQQNQQQLSSEPKLQSLSQSKTRLNIQNRVNQRRQTMNISNQHGNLLQRQAIKSPDTEQNLNELPIVINNGNRISNVDRLITKIVKTKIQNLYKILTMSQKYRYRTFKDRMYSFVYDKTFVKQSILYNSNTFNEENAQDGLLKEIEACLDKQKFKYFPVIPAYSNVKLLWDVLILITTLVGFIWIPLFFAYRFMIDTFYLNIGLAIYSTDILLSLNSGFYDKGQKFNTRGKIITNYFKKRFISDIVTNFPIYYLIFLRKNNNNNISYTDTNILDYPVLLMFYFRIEPFSFIKEKLQERIYSKKKYNSILELIELLFIVMYFAHIFACIWIFVAKIQIENNNQSWLDGIDFGGYQLKGNLGVTEYLFSFYFSIVTMSTVGYGDMSPTNELEMVFGIILMLFACGIFAFVLNKIGSIVEEIQFEKKKRNNVLQTVNGLLRKKNIDRSLSYQIREYVEYYYAQTLDDQQKDEQEIKNILSEPLRIKFIEQSNKIVLKDSPIFCNNFSNDILKQTVYLIEEIRYAPEQVIYKENENTDNIYFIVSGEVEVFLNNSLSMKPNKSITMLNKGAFGELEFFTGEQRKCSVISKDFTTLLKIDRENFLKVLKDYPLDYEIFSQIKDLIIQNKDMRKLKSSCYACFQNHYFTSCPYITYFGNKYKLFKNSLNQKQEDRINLPQNLVIDHDIFGKPIKETIQRNDNKVSRWENLDYIQEANIKFYEEKIDYICQQNWFIEGQYEVETCSSCEKTTESSESEDTNSNSNEDSDIKKALKLQPISEKFSKQDIIQEEEDFTKSEDIFEHRDFQNNFKNQAILGQSKSKFKPEKQENMDKNTQFLHFKKAQSIKENHQSPSNFYNNQKQKNQKLIDSPTKKNIVINKDSSRRRSVFNFPLQFTEQQQEISQNTSVNRTPMNNTVYTQNNVKNNNKNKQFSNLLNDLPHNNKQYPYNKLILNVNQPSNTHSRRQSKLVSNISNNSIQINNSGNLNNFQNITKQGFANQLLQQRNNQKIQKLLYQRSGSNQNLLLNNSPYKRQVTGFSTPISNKYIMPTNPISQNNNYNYLFNGLKQDINDLYQSKTQIYQGDQEFDIKKDFIQYFPYYNCEIILKKIKQIYQNNNKKKIRQIQNIKKNANNQSNQQRNSNELDFYFTEKSPVNNKNNNQNNNNENPQVPYQIQKSPKSIRKSKFNNV